MKCICAGGPAGSILSDIAYHDIFCIYHPADIVFVRRLAAQMRASGIDCWFDDSDFGKLSAESAQLKAGILQAYTVAIVLSQSSAESQLCNELVQHAVSHSKRIITLIRTDDISVEVHPAIVDNAYLFFRDQDDIVERIEQLRPHLEINEDLRLHTELLVAAERWRSSGRRNEHLLPAQRWEEARRWLAGANKRQPKPSQLQVEFIHSSRRGRSSGIRGRTGSRAHSLSLVFAALILVAVGAFLLQIVAGAISSGGAAAARTQAAQTQIALAATTASEGAVGLIDQLAATSARISESVGATASAATVAAVEAQATAQARATAARATQAHLPMRSSDGMRLLDAGRQALKAGDTELALALTWEAQSTLDDPGSAHRLLRLIAAQLDTAAQSALRGDPFALASPDVYSAALDTSQPVADQPASVLHEALPGTSLVGERLVVALGKSISLRDLANQPISNLPGDSIAHAGDKLVTLDDARATIYATNSGAEIHSWPAPLANLRALYLAADGSALVAVDDRIAWLLNAEFAEPRALGTGDAGRARDVVFAANGRRFVSLHAEMALLWDAQDGSSLAAFPLEVAADAQAAFHDNALVFFVPLDEGLAVLTRLSLDDYAAQRHLLVNVRLGALAADGASLALAQSDGSIILLDTTDGRLRRRMASDSLAASKLAVLPGAGRLLAAVGGELLLWHSASGELEARFSHGLPIVDFSYSPDAAHFVTRDTDDVFRLWTLENIDSLLERIESEYQPRRLTCAEREQYNARPLCL